MSDVTENLRGVQNAESHGCGSTIADAHLEGCSTLRKALPPNPKQAYGDKKIPLWLFPSSGALYGALALMDGATKYGPYNWRDDPIEAMTYVSACRRHLDRWVDGQELSEPEDWKGKKLGARPEIGHAIACLVILADAIEHGNLIDNRPPKLTRSRQELEDWQAP